MYYIAKVMRIFIAKAGIVRLAPECKVCCNRKQGEGGGGVTESAQVWTVFYGRGSYKRE